MKLIIAIFTLLILTASVSAQAPDKMSYQAVIRNHMNALVSNQAVGMRISILQGSPGGTEVYVEKQTPTTNANGLVSIEIGGGTIVSGSFSTINWANGPYFVKTETDPAGGTSYSITGTSMLLSVPYALHADMSDKLVYNAVATNLPSVIMNDASGNQRFNMKLNYDMLNTQIDINPIQNVPTSDVNLRFFRETNTSGLKQILFHRGNGTINQDAQIGIDGTNSYFQIYGGNFGIGTNAPARKLHVSDVMRLEPRSSAPTSPAKGDIYFDSVSNKLRVYDGTVWQNCW